jgi:hypothetical protein
MWYDFDLQKRYGQFRSSQCREETVTQIKVVLSHVPGSLAQVVEALRDANVKIEGMCNMEGYDDTMPLRLIVDKPDGAKKAIEALGEPVTFEQSIEVRSHDDKPSFVADVARALARESINIEAIFHASSGAAGGATIFIAVDSGNVSRAIEALSTV